MIRFLDEIVQAFVFALRLSKPVGETLLPKELDLADHRRIDVDQCFHRRDQKRSRTTSGIEKAQIRQHVEQQLPAEVLIEVHQQVGDSSDNS